MRCKDEHLIVLVTTFLIQASEDLSSVKFNSKGYGCEHNLGFSLKRTVTVAQLIISTSNSIRFIEIT